MERIVLPHESIFVAKFVQFYFENKPYFVAEKVNSGNDHADIFRNALVNLDVKYDQLSRQSSRNIPAKEGSNYLLAGIGTINRVVSPVIKIIKNHNKNSSVYKMGFNQNHLDDMLPYFNSLDLGVRV